MPQIQVDQLKIHVHVLYIAKIINAKESRFHGSVVMTLKKAVIQIWRFGFDTGQGCYLLLFFLLNYFCAIICF